MHPKIRDLRYQLVHNYCKTGELLSRASLFFPTVFQEIIQSCGISETEAEKCMALYRQWSHYETAEAWWCDGGGDTPRTPQDALSMLSAWKAVCLH